jgi:hypothetical protein
MTSLSVTITGADRVAALLTRQLAPAIEAGLMAVGAELQNELAPYPGQSGKPQPPKTARQRRFLHALGRRGGIPYRRTGDTGRSWTLSKAGSLRVVLANRSKGAAWVYLRRPDYFGNWRQLAAAIKAVEPRVRPIMEQAIKAGLKS